MERGSTWHKRLHCPRCPDYFHALQCCDLPCEDSALRIIGKSAPQFKNLITSSTAASRYTRPAEVIQEDINTNQLQLSDTKVRCAPLHLRQFFHLYNVNILSRAHIMFILVYIVAIECGFASKQHFLKLCRLLYPTNSVYTYHSKNVLFLSRQKPIYILDSPYETYFSIELRLLNQNFKNESLYSVLTAIVSGDYLVVTLTPEPTELKGFSSCLSISRYVLSKLTSREPVQQYFRNLEQLTLQLREEVFVPVRNEQLKYMKESCYPSILSVPSKVRGFIYDYFNESDFKNVAQVAKIFNTEIDERRVELKEDQEEFKEWQEKELQENEDVTAE